MDMRAGYRILLSALAAGAAGAVFTACSGAQTGTSAMAPQAQREAPRSSALLYVASSDGGPSGTVSIRSFPAGAPVKKISFDSYVGALCVDSIGNVWITTYAHRAWRLYEYPHGGNKPIYRIKLGKPHVARGCAVDPTTGNLATLDHEGVEIFRGGRQGQAIDYRLGVTPIACTFDGKGNLFIDGFQGSTAPFLIEELAKGSSKFERLSLDRPYGAPGGIAWDGAYVAVATSGFPVEPVIYRFVVSRKIAKVVQSVHPTGLHYAVSIAIYDGLLATAKLATHHVDIWTYPGDGEPIKKLPGRGPFTTTGLTISVAN
jgi:hypothetical protein